MKAKAVVVFSGGLDSTVLLYAMMVRGYTVLPVSVYYEQRHHRELDAARIISTHLGLEHTTLSLPIGRELPGSSQTDYSIPVPHGHYEAESMKKTVVPNRNMMLLALAGAVGIANGAEVLAYGAHAGDHAIYPDCRPVFIEAMRVAFSLCDWKTLALEVPFANMTKAQIVERGASLGVPFALTYSCYEGEPIHCGKCGTCVERREAFLVAGVPDPTTYAVPFGG